MCYFIDSKFNLTINQTFSIQQLPPQAHLISKYLIPDLKQNYNANRLYGYLLVFSQLTLFLVFILFTLCYINIPSYQRIMQGDLQPELIIHLRQGLSLIKQQDGRGCDILQSSFNFRMEIEQANILPLQLAVKYYEKWDCDVETIVKDQLYYKYLTGIGKVSFTNGNSYHGSFHYGLMQGKGTYSWSNGLKYEGTFKGNRVSGEGKITWKDGSYYTGQVIDGKREGEGQYCCSTDKSRYKGQWKDGLKSGKGTLTFINESVYQGLFQKGLRHGEGTMKYPSGNIYEGEWSKDKKEGWGTMHWYSSMQKYEGNWRNDLPEGEGTYYWLQNKIDVKSIKTIYKGEWSKGRRQGYGSFFYNNGCRLQGTFSNNLKEGLSVVTDQFGEIHTEQYLNDKIVEGKSEQRQFKLPDLNKPIIHNNEPTENIYVKMVDIESPLLDQSIFNLLLRENSHLRNDYKSLISNTNKEIFNGLNIEGVWRMVKELRITNEWLTLAKLNRLFFQGPKSQFSIQMPNKQKLELLKNHPNSLQQYHYQDMEWNTTFQQFKKLPLDWNQWSGKTDNVNLEDINLKKTLDLHHEDHIVLYRHFIVYILHIALLQHQQCGHEGKKLSFRKCLEKLFTTIQNPPTAVLNMPSMRTQKLTSDILTNHSKGQTKISIPQQYTSINHTLLDSFNHDRPSLLNTIDKTVTVRQIYTILCRVSILKEASQKMLFLERIERNMDVKGSLLKKENKSHFAAFEKVALTSPHFTHIMNYEMIGSQLDEILYKLLNRKIGNTHSKEEFFKKYKETIKNMVGEVEKRREEVVKAKKSIPFKRNRLSTKDKQREILLQKLEQQRKKRQEEARKMAELHRQQKQRLRMRKQDSDIKDFEESESSEQYYD